MPGTHPLRTAYARNHPDELAAFLAAQPYDTLVAALNGLPADAGVRVIAKLPRNLAVRLLATQSDATVANWLAQADLNDALNVLLHLREDRRSAVLASLPVRHMRRTLERLVVYPQKTVGALVDPTVVRLTAATTLEVAIATLRAGDFQQQEWIWVVDSDSRYLGLLDLSRALLAQSDQFTVGELALTLEPLRAETGLTAARDVKEWLKHPELPVVDYQNHLLGGLSRARLMSALQHDAPADIGILDSVTALANQYFRVMRICLDDLLGTRNRP
jgi:Mg/Co/Ni transporter MgtE